ncbi:MAG: COQ9 family protein [Alphaproteobacteria bacterium]
MAKTRTAGQGEAGGAAGALPPDGHRDAHEEKRAAILAATLAHVPFAGWSLAALQSGAEDCGYDRAEAQNAFPGGALEAIEHHSRLADARMLVAMEGADMSRMRVRERVAFAVRARLEGNAQNREAIRRALVTLALPTNLGVSLACLYRTVDAIWHGAGDESVDFNFYSKRGLLAGVYMATLLHWLDDASEGQEASWRFLDRRIAEVLRVPRMVGELFKIFKGFPFPSKVGKPPFPAEGQGQNQGEKTWSETK